MNILDRKFYHRDTLRVARELLGKKLVRRFNGLELSGMIVETEAYCGQADSACHAHRGKTQRNAVMFGKPGMPTFILRTACTTCSTWLRKKRKIPAPC